MVVTFWNVIESRMLFFCVHSEDLFYDQRHAACVHHATRMLASNVALLRRCTVDATQSIPFKCKRGARTKMKWVCDECCVIAVTTLFSTSFDSVFY